MSATREDFLIWCPEHGEEQSDARTIGAYSAENAAGRYMSKLHSEDGFAEGTTLEFMVQAPSGAVSRIAVRVAYSVDFIPETLSGGGR